ncbi:hypothetical protein U1Q18_004412 [Sarracenia purpurea var. burkii]
MISVQAAKQRATATGTTQASFIVTISSAIVVGVRELRLLERRERRWPTGESNPNGAQFQQAKSCRRSRILGLRRRHRRIRTELLFGVTHTVCPVCKLQGF